MQFLRHNRFDHTHLGMTDIEYAALAAKGYDPNLERMMIEAGSLPESARKLTRIVGLVKDKPPETDQEWDEFLNVWEGEA
jgi:hypothetical protein